MSQPVSMGAEDRVKYVLGSLLMILEPSSVYSGLEQAVVQFNYD